ncbi:MAG: hypothetical protein IK008_01115 [Bacteroidales bacterium]|nr:hypothetical protein [Bacteroidales bacterium]
MTNEIFSFKRFHTYFKYDATQMWRNHMKAALGIGLFGLFAYLVYVIISLITGSGWSGPGDDIISRFVMFMVAFTILELYQTRTYGYLTERKRGSAWLMVPASTFEKWLSMLIMTLIVIPLAFMLVFFAADALVALLDPTVEQSMLGFLFGVLKDFSTTLQEYNEFYEVNWSLWMLLPTFVLLGLCCNFLFFLLCGLIFRKYKILGGFLILLGLSLLLTLVSTQTDSLSFSISGGVTPETVDRLTSFLRSFNCVVAIIVAGLAGGIFWRLKTLKH